MHFHWPRWRKGDAFVARRYNTYYVLSPCYYCLHHYYLHELRYFDISSYFRYYCYLTSVYLSYNHYDCHLLLMLHNYPLYYCLAVVIYLSYMEAVKANLIYVSFGLCDIHWLMYYCYYLYLLRITAVN